METKKNIFFKLVTKLHVSLQPRWRHFTIATWAVAQCHNTLFVSAHHVKKTLRFFGPQPVITFSLFKAQEWPFKCS